MIDWHIKAREMREGGASIKGIVAALGQTRNAVKHVVAKVKCPIDHRYTVKAQWHTQARAMRAAGAKLKEIAAVFGKTPRAVSKATCEIQCPAVIERQVATTEWRAKAREMRQGGAKLRDIATALGKKNSTVQQALRQPLSAHGGRAKPLTEDQQVEFMALRAAGSPATEIARRFNWTRAETVSTYAAKLNLPRRRFFNWTPEIDNELRTLWAKRCTLGAWHRKGGPKAFLISDIARHFGTTRGSIMAAAERLGLPRPPRHPRKWTRSENRLLRKLWRDHEISLQQIALRLNRTKPSVILHRPWLGLPPRSPHQQSRIAVSVWRAMTKKERQRVPEWRMPDYRHQLTRPTRRRKPSPTPVSSGQPV